MSIIYVGFQPILPGSDSDACHFSGPFSIRKVTGFCDPFPYLGMWMMLVICKDGSYLCYWAIDHRIRSSAYMSGCCLLALLVGSIGSDITILQLRLIPPLSL